MTSIAMIAGTLPIALGLGEAAKSRTAMGIAIIGGLVLSTLITLIVVPAIFKYIDRFREFVEKPFRPDYDMDRVGKLDQRPYANEADFTGSRGGRRK
jgi:HAE1 family hydrophobic/amphiphilic exporter-1